MLKRLFLLALVLLSLPFNISAKDHEVIYTNDGKIYKGEVVEFIPNKSITMEQCEGGRVILDYSKVEKYAKEPEDIYLRKGYRGFCFLESCRGKNSYFGFSLSTVHGVQLCPNFFMGAGVQYRMGSETDRHLPLFLNAHYDVDKTEKTPYFDVRFGPDILLASDGAEIYSTSKMYDYYASLSFGYRVKHFVVDLGVETMHYIKNESYPILFWENRTDEWTDTYAIESKRYKALNFFLKFGLSF